MEVQLLQLLQRRLFEMRLSTKSILNGLFTLTIFFTLYTQMLINGFGSSNTWYVNDAGGSVYGTSTATNTCNGLYPAAYSIGVSPNCAVIHPSMILGTNGYNGTPTSQLMQSGDTLYIDGDSVATPGTQAQYMVGYGMPNSSPCNIAGTYNCYMQNPPNGTSGNPTSIIGTGTNKPQLWGVDRTFQVLGIGNYTNFTWLEITDHEVCGYNAPVDGCVGSPTYDDGIALSGSNNIFTDVYVHGFARYGINVPDAITTMGSNTFTRVWIIGNSESGMTTGVNNAFTGTTTFNQPIIEWSGCIEAYPLATGIDNPANYSNCYGQTSGGNGDGLAFGNDTSGLAGNWNIYGPGSISFNTQDGADLKHGTPGVGTDNIDKMRFEGNAGQQIKVTGFTDNITNNLIIGDCGWWQGSSHAAAGAMLLGDSCRAGSPSGTTILFSVEDGTTTNFYNNTIITYAIAFEADNSSSCTGTVINTKNNIIQGGYAWAHNTTVNPGVSGDDLTTNFYSDGSDGNGSGPCGAIVPTEDYNIIYNNKNSNYPCLGTHDKCQTSPGFTGGVFPAGTFQGPESTYYNGQSGITLLHLGGSSAAIGAGVNSLSYWNNSNDYYNVTQTNPSVIGAENLNSCAVNSFAPCFFNSDCCSGTCNTSNTCSGASVVGDVFSNLTIKGITFK